MRAEILIVGQGLAGTLLAWELEKAGLNFTIIDAGHGPAASAVAAGLINPVTGRRLVKTWRAETLLPVARDAYASLGAALGSQAWHDVRVRRFFASNEERDLLQARLARGELAPFVRRDTVDGDGLWIEGGGRIDLPHLLLGARARWQAQGRLCTAEVDWTAACATHELVIDCTGMGGARSGRFAFVPWEFSKGEMVEIEAADLVVNVVLSRGHAVVPLGPGRAWVGATHEPGVMDISATSRARDSLAASARELLGRSINTLSQRAGVRVNLPDKRPAAGRHPANCRLGTLNGLGAKGALFAPWLARQWCEHLTTNREFDPEIAVSRFWRRNSSQASPR